MKGASHIGSLEKKKHLYLTVGKEVTLTFSRKKKRLGRLVSINLSVNKLYELINNGLVDIDDIFNIGRVSLITRYNFHTTVIIDSEKSIANVEGKNIFRSGDILLFVEETQYITRDELYVLKKKDRDTYEKENRKKTQ